MATTKKMVYLACPYSHPDKAVVEERMRLMCIADANIIMRGVHTVTPLSKHFIIEHGDIPGDWSYWGDYSKNLIDRCDAVYVIMLDGWEDSVGVKEEIAYAKKYDISVIYCKPDGRPA